MLLSLLAAAGAAIQPAADAAGEPYARTSHTVVVPVQRERQRDLEEWGYADAVVDGDRARCWSYCVALHFAAPGTGRDDLAMGVQYRDELERVDGGWRIARRVTVQQWVRGVLPGPS